MSSDHDSELRKLEDRQRQLMDEMARLRADMLALRRQMDVEEVGEMQAEEGRPQGDPFDAAAFRSTPPPIPKSMPEQSEPAEVQKEVEPEENVKPVKVEPEEKPQPAAAKAKEEPAADRDMEMELGRVWLVRIGVGLLVTGLVFFSTYAYQHYVLKMAPGGRLAVLMMAAFAVMGAGWWCEVKRKLTQFGQVLIGGGMAGVYYLIYAAHHVDKLKVLESPAMAAVLMTLWTALMLAYATWRKSQVAAVMSVLLAGYAVVINPVGLLALFSALVLAVAAMVLMRRFGWMLLGAVSLGVTYVGFAIWQMTNDAGDAGVEFSSLIGYWVVFTASLLLGRRATAESVEGSAPWLPGTRWQSFFATANNAAFFGLLVVDLRALVGGASEVIRDPFWIYPMSFGVVLLAVMAISWLRVGSKAPLTQLYLAKGLGLVTLGIMTKLSGYQRHLTLVVEACLMMGAVVFRRAGKVVRVAAWIVYGLAFAFALSVISGGSHLSAVVFWVAACGFAVLSTLDARRRMEDENDTPNVLSESSAVLPVVSGLIVMIAGWASGLPNGWESVGVLSAAFVVLLIGYGMDRWKGLDCPFVHKPHEWLVPLTLIVMIHAMFDGTLVKMPYVISCVMALGGIFLHVVRHRGDNGVKDDTYTFVSFPLLAVGLLATWITCVELGNWQIVIALMAAVGVVELGRRFGLNSLKISGCVLLVLAVVGILQHWTMQVPDWMAVIVPMAMILVVALLERERDTKWRTVLRCISSALLLVTVFGFGVLMELTGAGLLLGAAALVLIVIGRKIRAEEFLVVGLSGVAVALIEVAVGSVDRGVPLWLASTTVLLSVLVQLVWKLRSEGISWPKVLKPSVVSTPVAAVAVFTALVLLTPQVTQRFDGQGHAVIWAIIGIGSMVLGFVLRERGYRLPALMVLGLALGHVLVVDVWQFDTLGRVLSFSALGVAMILIGFFYNRFQMVLKRVATE